MHPVSQVLWPIYGVVAFSFFLLLLRFLLVRQFARSLQFKSLPEAPMVVQGRS
jgi:hypothetical protein